MIICIVKFKIILKIIYTSSLKECVFQIVT